MQYVMVVEVDDRLLDGDDSIEHACNIVNYRLRRDSFGNDLNLSPVIARPLSEVIAS